MASPTKVPNLFRNGTVIIGSKIDQNFEHITTALQDSNSDLVFQNIVCTTLNPDEITSGNITTTDLTVNDITATSITCSTKATTDRVGYQEPLSAVIASDKTVVILSSFVELDSATSTELIEINVGTGFIGTNGTIITLFKKSGASTITIKNGVSNIDCGADLTLSTNSIATFILSSSWKLLTYSEN